MLDLLLPRRCLVCGCSGTQLCRACCAALPRLTPPLCAPVRRADGVARRTLSGVHRPPARLRLGPRRRAYEHGVRRLVAAWKEQGLRSLGRVAAGIVVERLPRPAADALVFVPADGGRRLKRGYHPAEQLARELADAWRLPCLLVLLRIGPSRPQRGLARADRRRNVRRGFDSRRRREAGSRR